MFAADALVNVHDTPTLLLKVARGTRQEYNMPGGAPRVLCCCRRSDPSGARLHGGGEQGIRGAPGSARLLRPLRTQGVFQGPEQRGSHGVVVAGADAIADMPLAQGLQRPDERVGVVQTINGQGEHAHQHRASLLHIPRKQRAEAGIEGEQPRVKQSRGGLRVGT